jgi:hypothetical protein
MEFEHFISAGQKVAGWDVPNLVVFKAQMMRLLRGFTAEAAAGCRRTLI